MPTIRRRVLWSLPLVALVILGMAWVWNTGRGGDYSARGIDIGPRADETTWSLFAVEYARSDDLPLERLVEGVEPGQGVDMSWYFWISLGHGRVVLIDTGTDRLAERPDGKTAARWRIRRSRTVLDALAAVGLTPADVTDVVLTHRHWDHVEGLEHFDNARVHIHAGEWEAIGDDEFQGEVSTFVDTPVTPLPGLTILEAGHHTPHHCVVELVCGAGSVVVAGDAAYLYRNLDDLRSLTDRVGEMPVLPGHDPEIFDRYPSPREGVAQICP